MQQAGFTNKKLSKAKANVDDEFYTRYEDIENEIKHYEQFLNDKIVYLNCDSENSNFYKYFLNNFKRLNLKKLIATHYNNDQTIMNTGVVITKDENGKLNGHRFEVKDNGSFESDEVRPYLIEADVVITNPPFSLLKKFFKLLIDLNKKFLIIGGPLRDSNQLVFNKIKNKELWIRSTHLRSFIGPDGTERLAPALWYTNIEDPKDKKWLELTEVYTPENYPKFNGYDAINVDRFTLIPKDYAGEIGVPITAISKLNTDQFEITGIMQTWDNKPVPVIGEKNKFSRILIINKQLQQGGKHEN